MCEAVCLALLDGDLIKATARLLTPPSPYFTVASVCRPSPDADTVAVQELFKRLATNEKLCAEFAKELRSSGLLK